MMRRSKGRRMILAIMLANILASVLLIIYLAVYSSPGSLLQHAGRLILYVALFVFLYRGLPWARWAAAVLFILSGVSGIIGGAVMLFYLVDPLFVYTTGIVSVVNLISAAILLFSPSVKDHFRRERQDRS